MFQHKKKKNIKFPQNVHFCDSFFCCCCCYFAKGFKVSWYCYQVKEAFPIESLCSQENIALYARYNRALLLVQIKKKEWKRISFTFTSLKCFQWKFIKISFSFFFKYACNWHTNVIWLWNKYYENDKNRLKYYWYGLENKGTSCCYDKKEQQKGLWIKKNYLQSVFSCVNLKRKLQ